MKQFHDHGGPKRAGLCAAFRADPGDGQLMYHPTLLTLTLPGNHAGMMVGSENRDLIPVGCRRNPILIGGNVLLRSSCRMLRSAA